MNIQGRPAAEWDVEGQIKGGIKVNFLIFSAIALGVFDRAEIHLIVQAKIQRKHTFPAWNDEKACLEAVHYPMFTKNVKIRRIFYINIHNTAFTSKSPLGIAEAESEDGIVIKQWPAGIFA